MSETFWVAISFCVFVGAVVFFARNFIAQAFDKAIHSIQSMVISSESERNKSQHLLDKSVAIIEKTKGLAKQILASAEEEAKKIQDNTQARVDEYISARMQMATSKISVLENAIIDELRQRLMREAINDVQKYFDDHGVEKIELKDLQKILSREANAKQVN